MGSFLSWYGIDPAFRHAAISRFHLHQRHASKADNKAPINQSSSFIDQSHITVQV